MNETAMVWLFQGDGANAVSGCFATQEAAEQWIAEHKLSGVLTAYPLGVPIYGWVQAQGYWQPTRAPTRATKKPTPPSPTSIPP